MHVMTCNEIPYTGMTLYAYYMSQHPSLRGIAGARFQVPSRSVMNLNLSHHSHCQNHCAWHSAPSLLTRSPMHRHGATWRRRTPGPGGSDSESVPVGHAVSPSARPVRCISSFSTRKSTGCERFGVNVEVGSLETDQQQRAPACRARHRKCPTY